MSQVPFPRPDTFLADDWTFLVFLLCLILVAWSRNSDPGNISRLWHNAFNIRLMRQDMREETQHRRSKLAHFINFCLILGLLVYYTGSEKIAQHYPHLHGVLLYSILVLGIAVLYQFKGLVIQYITHLASNDFTLSEYRYSLFLLNRIAGLILIPSALLASYSDPDHARWYVLSGFGLFGIVLLYRWFRGVQNAFRSNIPSFYIFFYICTLEFLPLAAAAKAISL